MRKLSDRIRGSKRRASIDEVEGQLDERDDTMDPTWLLKAAAVVDTRYNAGQTGYGDLIAVELRKRAGSVA